ncbi:hypothetical protein AALO_G00222570 [Alosa alosa]|uniref:Uncharacterized protein n=1 Tax=Alosa alosa TaxID=278164 RepID=A0AAV6FXC7_9TELE|nr:hypothetical protein AALO_G00222570 [Alosa alosa]
MLTLVMVSRRADAAGVDCVLLQQETSRGSAWITNRISAHAPIWPFTVYSQWEKGRQQNQGFLQQSDSYNVNNLQGDKEEYQQV